MPAMSSKVTPVSFSTYTFARLLPIEISPLCGFIRFMTTIQSQKSSPQPSRTCYLGKAGAEPTFPSCRLGQRFSMLTGTPSFALVSPSNLPVVVRFSDFW